MIKSRFSQDASETGETRNLATDLEALPMKPHTALAFFALPFCCRFRNTPQAGGERPKVFVIVQPHEIHLPLFGCKAWNKQFLPCFWLYPRASHKREKCLRTITIRQDIRYQCHRLHLCSGHAQVAADRLGTLESRERDDLGDDRLCCPVHYPSAVDSQNELI